MSQQIINNGESGLNVRNALNEMFAELYALAANAQPLRIVNMSANTIQAIPANSFVMTMQIRHVSGGSPTIRVGTTPNGQDLMDDTVISDSQIILIQTYYGSLSDYYFTYTSGTGVLNVRIDIILNYN